MKYIILLLTCFYSQAIAQTGSGAGISQFIHNNSIGNVSDSLGLPVNIISGGSGGGTVTQGPKGSIPQSWYVQPCDGTNCQSFLSTGEGKVSITQPLPSFASTPTFNLGLLNGAATAANQSTLITNLGSPFQAGGSIGNTSFGISGLLPAFASTPTVNSAQSGTWSTGRTWSLLNTTDSVNVGNFPASQTVTGSVSVSNFPATQAISAASLPLPTGASTEATLSALNTKVTTSANGIKVDGSAVTQPVSGSVSISGTASISGTVTANAGTNLNTSALALESGGNLAGINGKLGSLGQKTMSGSAPVVIASDQSSIPVSGTITATNSANGNTGSAVPTQATQVAGSDGTNLRALKVSSAGVLSVDGSAVTQPVSGTVSVSNTSFIATQATGTNLHTVVDSGSVSVSNFPATQAISATSLPLPTGAATSSNQTNVQSSPGTSASTALTIQGSASGVPIPISGSITASNPSVSATGAAAPSSATYMGANKSGNIVAPLLDASGLLQVNGSGVTQPVSATSLPLPTGASTSALQSSVQGSASGGTAATSSQLNGGIYNSTQPTLTNGQQASIQLDASGNVRQTDPDSTVTGTLGVLNATVTLPLAGDGSAYAYISGTWSGSIQFYGVTLGGGANIPMNAACGGPTNVYSTAAITSNSGCRLLLPAGFQSIIAQMTAYTSGTATVTMEGSVGTTNVEAIQLNASNLNMMQADSYITGQSAQTALVNNILTATAGTAASDTLGYKSASVQVVSSGTGGAYIFEGSNDNVNFQSIPVYNQLILTGTPITGAITATASQLIYTFPLSFRYLRLRISTAITGGSVQAFTKLSQASWSPAVYQVAQSTTGNLLTTSTISSGTVTTVSSVTSDQEAIPGIIADVASSAITTTTTTATLTPTFGNSYVVQIPVTAVSGTTPTYQVTIQESNDSGTNWYNVYAFPTITTTGFYYSPPLLFKGNRVRYVQTLTGTTPSFTRAINRLQMTASATAYPVSNNATQSSSTVSTTAATLSAPQNSTGFILQNLSTNTTNLRFALGGTATTTVGIELLPGQDSGFIPAGSNISIIAESGTVSYNLQWIQQ